VEPAFADPATQPGPGPTGGSAGRPPTIARLRWPIALLAALIGVFVGAAVQRAVDHRSEARDLYRTQVLTTVWRILNEEHRQLALPAAQRSAIAFGDLLDGINQDIGVNGHGTLQVSMGSGSVAQPIQAAFSVTVSSPYGSTTIAVWSIVQPGSTDDGACVQSSTLLRPGRATANLDLGGGAGVQPCLPGWWRGPITASHPNLGAAGIDQSGG
jgi:hypothetical protein